MDYKERILTVLVEKYRSSKKNTGTNVVNRATTVTPDKIYKRYESNHASVKEKEALDAAAAECLKRGYVTLEYKRYSDDLKKITLVDKRVKDIENFLKCKYGYQPHGDKEKRMQELVIQYKGKCALVNIECNEIETAIQAHKSIPAYEEEEAILQALSFIGTNMEDLYLREASMMIYGYSKRFLEDKGLLTQVSSIAREYLQKPKAKNELPDEILADFHITKEPDELCMKGKMIVERDGQKTDIAALPGVKILADDATKFDRIIVRTPMFMTVENYTSWMRMNDPDVTYFYLGGFMKRHQRDFLKKVYADNPNVQYLHFGDIDVNGFSIHEHLCSGTGIPFKMYHMSVKDLKDPRYANCLQVLTSNDKARIKKIRGEVYQETIAYMLENNVKLEQEIISYVLNHGRKGKECRQIK